MSRINLRECIKRKIAYTVVTYKDGEEFKKELFYGEVSGEEIEKILFKKYKKMLFISLVEYRIEERYITLEDFLEHSKLIE